MNDFLETPDHKKGVWGIPDLSETKPQLDGEWEGACEQAHNMLLELQRFGGRSLQIPAPQTHKRDDFGSRTFRVTLHSLVSPGCLWWWWWW